MKEKDINSLDHTSWRCQYHKFDLQRRCVCSPKSPQTGDNSNVWQWFALLFVSGGLMTVTGVYGKKKSSAK